MTAFEITSEILGDVKNYLNITWDDDATDKNIKNMIASGVVYLNNKAGSELEYNVHGLPRTLLFEYVRYMRDNALEVFENNYRSLILAMQNEQAVNRVENTVQK